jgi:hypothetical protein
LSLAVVHRRHLFDVAGGGKSAVLHPPLLSQRTAGPVVNVTAGTTEQTHHGTTARRLCGVSRSACEHPLVEQKVSQCARNPFQPNVSR